MTQSRPDPSPALPSWLRVNAGQLWIAVKVQPRSSANQVVGSFGDELRIKVTAPPVDSAANETLLSFLARALECPRNRLELVRGHASRHKIIRIHGLTAEAVIEKLTAEK